MLATLASSLNPAATHAVPHAVHSALAAAGGSGEPERFTYVPAEAGVGLGGGLAALVPILALVAAVICLGALLFKKDAGGKSKWPAFLTFGALGVGFVCTLVGFLRWDGATPSVITLFEWIHLHWPDARWPDGVADFAANIGFYMDGLSWLWMLFVTGLASMICLYASEYMAGDKGYARFFAAFGLFVVSMACLVMGDNLLLLYLGWEGVGLCSYLLIGYFYDKPSAVAAAKKAFIVNRVGDLGLALGIYFIWATFGTIEYETLFRCIDQGVDAAGNALPLVGTWQSWLIPLLLIVGAFGKSAQFPLYVWLPDAMEGPTPVSALIHAATMVTAGVYLIARMFPLFTIDPDMHALHAVAWIGTFTALLAATIGMAQFDIKRIMAYSTVSQLGYMFAGLGFLTAGGAAYHVFTHAFFKATLFLACGAVMHGFAGQLDLRKLSGLWHMPGWRITSVAMLVGCLNLAGVAFTAGYFSKDMILAEAFYTPDSIIRFSSMMGWLLLLTAGLTAYYTFRVFFRVFVGPEHYEPGDEHHAGADDHSHAPGEDHAAEHEAAAEAAHAPDPHGGANADDHGHNHGHHHGGFHPHPPGWAINTVLAVLAIGSILAALPYFVNKDAGGWVPSLLAESTASYKSAVASGHAGAGAGAEAARDGADAIGVTLAPNGAAVGDATGEAAAILPARFAPEAGANAAGPTHGTILGMDPHKVMYYVSAVIGLTGILIAAYLHGPRGGAGLWIGARTQAARSRADDLVPLMGPVPRWAQHKWYVDELYNAIIRVPLLVVSHIFHAIDKLIVDGLIVDTLFGRTPKALGRGLRPSQSGVLHGYATGMAIGIGILLLIVGLLSL